MSWIEGRASLGLLDGPHLGEDRDLGDVGQRRGSHVTRDNTVQKWVLQQSRGVWPVPRRPAVLHSL